jgi:hypothetical protein
LQVGDRNTSFFQKQAKARLMRNNVSKIKSHNGEILTSYEKIKEVASLHFQGLYVVEAKEELEEQIEMLEHIP